MTIAGTGATLAAVVLAGTLALATAAGVTQARRMTRLRQQAIQDPADLILATRVRHGAVRAGILRAMIASLSLALLTLVTALVT